MPAATLEPRNTVASLTKGLRVLEAFKAERPELSISQVAAAAGLDAGTAYRMLNTLAAAGYVEKAPGTKLFRLTLKVTNLGFSAIGRTDLRDIARPILRRLVGQTGEAASLGVLKKADILYIERVRAGHTRLGVDVRIGSTIPAYCSTIGHSLLAFLPDDLVSATLEVTPLSEHVPIVPMSRDWVLDYLKGVRANGYAFSDSFIAEGLLILAMPVLDADGMATAAVSVAAPKARIAAEEMVATFLEPVREAAHSIATAIAADGTVLSGYG